MADAQSRKPSRPTRRRLVSLAAAGGVTIAATAAPPHAVPASAHAGDALVGSWMSVFNRSTGEMLSGLATFHADGTVVNATSDHLAGSPSHGHWRSFGHGQYTYSVMRIDVDSTGNFAGFRAIDADLTLDPTAGRIPLLRRTDPSPQNILPASGS